SVEAAEEFAARLRESCPTPALAIAVADASGPIWSTAFGKADLEAGIDATPEHYYRLGSVSKVLTTVAAARLVSRGLLELDTPIAYWLPDLPERHRATTLLQLFTHRGGIRHYRPSDYDPAAPGGAITDREYSSRGDILALFINDELVAEPGTKVSYSSFGYSLASIVMEIASGQAFLDLVFKEIGQAFGLDSLAADEPGMELPLRVQGYIDPFDAQMLAMMTPDIPSPAKQGETVRIPFYNPAFCWAGAGFLLSMPDCAHFGAAMLDGAASRITREERALLFTPLTEKSDQSPPLGLGWRVDEDRHGRLRWHHAGATLGGRAGLIVYPELGLSVALASNTMTRPGDVLGPASELADIFAS
ncbi:MAG TPA: serine hydrolase domain-containing protein, partial [Sphingomonadaceae bacterium]|nr:serine hydrolase domain-containing protein [Sphingomonadaceae bacterium]